MSTAAELIDRRTELQRERETLLLEQEVAQLKQEQQFIQLAMQEVPLQEGWGDLVDPSEHLYDDPSFGFGNRTLSPVSQIHDRKHGRNRPIFETEYELAAIRGAARLIADTHPTALGMRETLTSYVLGDGFSYEPKPLPGCPDGLSGAVKVVLKEFFGANRWQAKKEEEAFDRAHRDGEVFMALLPSMSGVPRLKFVEPEQVTEPASPPEIEDWLGWHRASDWTFGVHADHDDMEAVHGYYVQWTDNAGDFDYIPADRMHHVAVNVDSGVKRGLSDFYAVQSHLTNTGKLDRNVALGAAILSAIIGIRQYPQGTTQGQAESLGQSGAWRIRTRAQPSGNTKTEYTQHIAPGSWLGVPFGQEYKQSPLANQGVGNAFVTIKQALLRTIGMRRSMPEFLISGDASNANYSNTIVAESPWVKFCYRKQNRFKHHYAELLWKMLAMVASAGRFERFGVQTLAALMAYIDLQIEAPIVEARDRDRETNRRKVLCDNGILSPESWSEQEGFDHKREVARGAKRAEMTLPSDGVPAMPAIESRQGRLQQAATLLWEGYP
jgi:hypothetical protein